MRTRQARALPLSVPTRDARAPLSICGPGRAPLLAERAYSAVLRLEARGAFEAFTLFALVVLLLTVLAGFALAAFFCAFSFSFAFSARASARSFARFFSQAAHLHPIGLRYSLKYSVP